MNAEFERTNVKGMLKDLQDAWNTNPGTTALKQAIFKDQMNNVFYAAVSEIKNAALGYKVLGMTTQDWFDDVLEWMTMQGFLVTKTDDPKRFMIKYHKTGTLSDMSFIIDMHTK